MLSEIDKLLEPVLSDGAPMGGDKVLLKLRERRKLHGARKNGAIKHQFFTSTAFSTPSSHRDTKYRVVRVAVFRILGIQFPAPF
jgi:hypothetical protein